MKYKIFPPIGIARLGNSDDFFVGPEWPGGLGVEIAADGTETDVTSLKDQQFRVKRQAARFRIFEFEDETVLNGQPIQLPPGALIKWSVHLANKKTAIQRTFDPPAAENISLPITTPLSDKVLDGGVRDILGANATPVAFTIRSVPTEPRPNYLGELRTDSLQHLLVFGGRGDSFGDRQKLNHYYKNESWYDDVSDGPVKAEIIFPDGTTISDVEPAWVIVAPPDFAPTIPAIVTLHDLLFQVGYEHFNLPIPAVPSFTEHIYPIVKRAGDFQWVNPNEVWSKISNDFAELSKSQTGATDPSLRTKTLEVLRKIQKDSTILYKFTLMHFQNELLDLWEGGEVKDDWRGIPAINREISPEGLTRAALGAGVGARLQPGIEAGNILKIKQLYSTPFSFRFSNNLLKAGDITAFMAVPWQADFWRCDNFWWPSQRPDIIRRSTNQNDFERWVEGINSFSAMVSHVNKLGMVLPKTDDQGQVVSMQEEGRDLSALPRRI
ncbi:MAG: hypothetical protein DU489_06010 [Nitrosomonas sp.]|uniref:LodA/GoxA family CTQ-dependent oxidase n=1 Tax=Nitrosomonas sp. TaxID=42353 RepID=UPI0032ED3FE3